MASMGGYAKRLTGQRSAVAVGLLALLAHHGSAADRRPATLKTSGGPNLINPAGFSKSRTCSVAAAA